LVVVSRTEARSEIKLKREDLLFRVGRKGFRHRKAELFPAFSVESQLGKRGALRADRKVRAVKAEFYLEERGRSPTALCKVLSSGIELLAKPLCVARALAFRNEATFAKRAFC
jgi:hypothetical protein